MEIPTKIKHGISVIAFSAVAGAALASSYIPWKLGSARGLGSPLFTYEGIGIYPPWDFFYWYAKFGHDIPLALASGRTILAACIALGGFAAYKIITAGSKEFGFKEWGDRAYAKSKGLLHKEPKGIVLGLWEDGTLMCDDSEVAVAVTGASRSGKSASVVFGTLLSWQESLFVTDPSGELYAGTARWRATLGPAPYLDYNDPYSARKNPWDEIRRGTVKEVGDIQSLVGILMDTDGDPRKRPSYWEKDGAIFYCQVMRYMLAAFPLEKQNFGELRRQVTVVQPLLDAMMQFPDEDIQGIAYRFDAMNPDQKQGVEAEAGTALKLWADPLIRQLTSSSEFTLSDLMAGDKPFTLYLRNSLDQADRLMPLTRMLVQQLTSLISDIELTPDGRRKKHKLLCLYEEFPEMGRLGTLQRHLANGAKYGFRFLLVMQAKSSIEENYGRYSTVLKNCPIQVSFPSTSDEENEVLSRLLGTGVEVKETIQKPKSSFFGKSSDGTKSVTTGRRRLLDAGEIRSLPENQQFVVITPGKPMKTLKLRWFEREPFASRGDNIRGGAVPPGQHPDFGRDPVGVGAPPEPPPEPSEDTARVKVSYRLSPDMVALVDKVSIATGQTKSEALDEMLRAIKSVNS